MRSRDLLVGDALLLGPLVDRQIDGEQRVASRQPLGVPLLGVGLFGDVPRDKLAHDLMAQVRDGLVDVVVGHDVDALVEDDLALVVHHVVVLKDLLADVEVARLDLFLSHFQSSCSSTDG